MASSKIIELPNLENPLEITLKENVKEIDFSKNETKEFLIKRKPKKKKKEHLDDIDKERLVREWKKTLSYYSLHPEDFYFKLSDL